MEETDRSCIVLKSLTQTDKGGLILTQLLPRSQHSDEAKRRKSAAGWRAERREEGREGGRGRTEDGRGGEQLKEDRKSLSLMHSGAKSLETYW